MREHDQAYLPAGRALGSGAGCPTRRPVQPGAGRGRQRVGLGGLWLQLVPVACCGGPLLVAGLAPAGALAWGGVGPALAPPPGGGPAAPPPPPPGPARRGAPRD